MLRLLAATQRVVPEVEYELEVTHDRESVGGSRPMPDRIAVVGLEQHEPTIVPHRPFLFAGELQELLGLAHVQVNVDAFHVACGATWEAPACNVSAHWCASKIPFDRLRNRIGSPIGAWTATL